MMKPCTERPRARITAALLLLSLLTLPLGAEPVRSSEAEAQGALLEALRERLAELPDEDLPPDRRPELRAMMAEMARLTADGTLLPGDLRGLEAEIRTYVGGRDGYRNAYRRWIRLAAVGHSAPELTLRGGRRFEAIEIREVTDRGIVIRHRNGSAGIPFVKLPERWRERYECPPEPDREGGLSEEEQREWIAARRAELEHQAITARAAELDRLHAASRAASGVETEAGDDAFDSRLQSSGRLEPAKGLRPARLQRSGRLGARRPFGSRR